jgi:hypothetical protein
LHTLIVCGPCDAFHALLLTHHVSEAWEGLMLVAPVAALVEKIGPAQVPKVGTVVVVVAARTVVAVVAVVVVVVVAGAAVVVAGTVVVVDGTLVVGGSVTGTALACGSPSRGVVVVDAATR